MMKNNTGITELAEVLIEKGLDGLGGYGPGQKRLCP
jgi:hypothetical protein